MQKIDQQSVSEEIKSIKFELTPDEISDKQDTLVDLLNQVQELRTELKRISADYKKKIKDIDAQVSDLARVLQDGFEVRPVHCRLVPDHNLGVMTYFDEEDAIVYERPLCPSERQLMLVTGE